jgi:hypothetical protein
LAGRCNGRGIAQITPDRFDAQFLQFRVLTAAEGSHDVAPGHELLRDRSS